MQCLLDHIVLNVNDIDTVLKFYSEVLGLETERLEDYQAGGVPFPSVRLNANTLIDLFPNTKQASEQPSGQTNLNHFCLTVDAETWPLLLQRLQDHKISLEEGPVRRWGAQGHGLSIYFRDPEANLIEVRHYGESAQ